MQRLGSGGMHIYEDAPLKCMETIYPPLCFGKLSWSSRLASDWAARGPSKGKAERRQDDETSQGGEGPGNPRLAAAYRSWCTVQRHNCHGHIGEMHQIVSRGVQSAQCSQLIIADTKCSTARLIDPQRPIAVLMTPITR